VGRSWWFLTGVGSILLVTVSVVGVYAGTLFWDRAVQNIVLLMITPMLLALGAPLTLLREVLPEPATRRASRVLHSATARGPSRMTTSVMSPRTPNSRYQEGRDEHDGCPEQRSERDREQIGHRRRRREWCL
jgi:cytochrome c oxidase assembly factor CtaG